MIFSSTLLSHNIILVCVFGGLWTPDGQWSSSNSSSVPGKVQKGLQVRTLRTSTERANSKLVRIAAAEFGLKPVLQVSVQRTLLSGLLEEEPLWIALEGPISMNRAERAE